MSRLTLRIAVVFVLAAFAFLRWPIVPVHAGGDISSDTDQSGSSDSGDAVGGQVVGVTSSGSASVDATNRSEDVDISTGDASGSNTADVTVNAPRADQEGFLEQLIEEIGLPDDATEEEVLAFLEFFLPPEEFAEVAAFFEADEFVGDLAASTTQSGDVETGDAIAGQVIGLVTPRRGQADLVLSNESTDTSVESGDTDLTNASSSTVETTSVAAPK